MRLSDSSEKCSWFTVVSTDISQHCLQLFSRRVNHLSLPRIVHKAARLAHSLKPKLPFARASVGWQNVCIQKGVLFWWSQVLSDGNSVGDICVGWKRSTEHGLDGQLCGVIDIWWQTETKNCTTQDAKVARALKFPGTSNASTFETTVSLLRAVLPASSNNSAATLQSTKSHTLVQ